MGGEARTFAKDFSKRAESGAPMQDIGQEESLVATAVQTFERPLHSIQRTLERRQCGWLHAAG
jgi:hypothetical protein